MRREGPTPGHSCVCLEPLLCGAVAAGPPGPAVARTCRASPSAPALAAQLAAWPAPRARCAARAHLCTPPARHLLPPAGRALCGQVHQGAAQPGQRRLVLPTGAVGQAGAGAQGSCGAVEQGLWSGRGRPRRLRPPDARAPASAAPPPHHLFCAQHAAENASLREIIHDGFLHPQDSKCACTGTAWHCVVACLWGHHGLDPCREAGTRWACLHPGHVLNPINPQPDAHCPAAAGAWCLAAPAAARWCTAWRCLTRQAT